MEGPLAHEELDRVLHVEVDVDEAGGGHFKSLKIFPKESCELERCSEIMGSIWSGLKAAVDSYA